MRPSIKKRWLAALRSGKYKKGIGRLKDGDKFCCLGVLCNIMKPSIKKKFYIEENDTCISSELYHTTLSLSLRDYLGIKTWDHNELWSINDRTETFDEVIKYIKICL